MCSRCDDLCQTVPILTPGELQKVVRVATANLDDGTIVEITSGEEGTPLSTWIAAGPRPDVIKSDFKCSECGELFHLRCETYHGSGGYWSYASEPALRDALRK